MLYIFIINNKSINIHLSIKKKARPFAQLYNYTTY